MASPPPRRTWAELVTAVDKVMSIPDRDTALFAISADLIPTAIGYISTMMPSQQCAHLQLIHRLFSQNLNSDLMAEAILNMPVLDLARSVVSDHPLPVAPSRSSAPTAATPKPHPTPQLVAKPTRSSGGASDMSTVRPHPTPYVEIPLMKVERPGRVQPESLKVEMKRVESLRLDRRPAEPPKMETWSRVAQTQWALTDVCVLHQGGLPVSHSGRWWSGACVPELPHLQGEVRALCSATRTDVEVCHHGHGGSIAAITSCLASPGLRQQSRAFKAGPPQAPAMTPMSPPYLDPRITHLERDMANMHWSLEDLHGMVQDMAVTQKAGASASSSARVQPPPQPLYKVPARPTASGSVAKVASSSTLSAAAAVESEGESDEEEANDEEDDEDYGEVDEGPLAGAA
ncbi:hypothetical protein NEOLEDRAFT_1181821 [Neolentinus lepideus HHB14362 ss-1]|uniref:Uncharacterized protein n=1 Tax=Neolentinus lepideus HHB14362 ss-1 TaxID=1314782 RepID=A0A165PQ14_9AGAM|nr:hypothetical protein NEOLEDRAFT_1181821 [Neolentinus lepideus HHB14362 ss-1]